MSSEGDLLPQEETVRTKDKFEVLYDKLVLRHPESQGMLTNMLVMYKKSERARANAKNESEKYKYALAKEQDEHKDVLAEGTVTIVIVDGIVKEIQMLDKTDYEENLIGKSEDSEDLDYFVGRLQEKGFIVNFKNNLS